MATSSHRRPSKHDEASVGHGAFIASQASKSQLATGNLDDNTGSLVVSNVEK